MTLSLRGVNQHRGPGGKGMYVVGTPRATRWKQGAAMELRCVSTS